jgi:hypothetical protein
MYKIKPEGRSNIARNTVRKNSEMRKGTCRHKGKEKEYKKKKEIIEEHRQSFQPSRDNIKSINTADAVQYSLQAIESRDSRNQIVETTPCRDDFNP